MPPQKPAKCVAWFRTVDDKALYLGRLDRLVEDIDLARVFTNSGHAINAIRHSKHREFLNTISRVFLAFDVALDPIKVATEPDTCTGHLVHDEYTFCPKHDT